MNFGTQSTIEFLATRLMVRWIPKWYEAFTDSERGGFYERLGQNFKPVETGTRRLLTQCRQLATYSHASLQPECNIPGLDLKRHFEHIVKYYYVEETGGWRFSTYDDGNPRDEYYDLYALAFVIFSFSHYYRASGDDRARLYALDTLHFIETSFRLPDQPGLTEAIGPDLKIIPQLRRQNPHMHLLEACLFALDTWSEPVYRAMADEIIGLFRDYFYDAPSHHLCEFFSDDLTPHPEKGALVEPGHYYEWIWLLQKHGDGHDDVCAGLLDWANAHGWDDQHGGIYDVLNPSGAVIADTKRLWPFTEAIKANALMLDKVTDKIALKKRMADMVGVFQSHYMQERGFWVEWRTRDFKPQTDYMPGTTIYHVYFGIVETRRVLRGRGRSVSLGIGGVKAYYSARRKLSAIVRGLRRGQVRKSG